MDFDSRAVLHFFQQDHVLLLFRLPGLLCHFELVLPVVHDSDDGRTCERGDFNEIESLLYCRRHGGIYFHDSKLSPIRCDNSNRADADLPVDARRPLCGILNVCRPPRWKRKSRTLS